MAKKTNLDKLQQWRREKKEQYAAAIMGVPEKRTIIQSMPFPGCILIMGDRRFGKTGMAHRIAEEIHNRRNVPAIVHLPPSTTSEVRKNIQKLVPDWATVTTDTNDWTKHSVVIFDETAQTAHARRTQSGDAVELDNLIGISGQREQLLIFISHHSKKIDPNVVRGVNRIIWKKPTYAHQLFERDELSDFTMKAFDFFNAMRNGNAAKSNLAMKKTSLVLDMDTFKFLQVDNRLPSYWSDALSNLFQDIAKVGKKAPGY